MPDSSRVIVIESFTAKCVKTYNSLTGKAMFFKLGKIYNIRFMRSYDRNQLTWYSILDLGLRDNVVSLGPQTFHLLFTPV